MSAVFKRLFQTSEKKRNEARHTAAAAINTLEEALRSQDALLVRLDSEIASLQAEARKRLIAGDKKGAMMSLTTKKRVEIRRERVMRNRDSLTAVQLTLFSQSDSLVVVEAIQKAADAVKDLVSNTKLSKIDSILDSIERSNEIIDDVEDRMKDLTASDGNMTPLSMRVSDADLEAELEALIDKPKPAAAAEVGRTTEVPLPALPQAPTTPVARQPPDPPTAPALRQQQHHDKDEDRLLKEMEI